MNCVYYLDKQKGNRGITIYSPGVNLTVQEILCQDARIQDLYFNISEMKLSITSLYNISGAPKYGIISTEKSDVIDIEVRTVSH